MKKFLLFLLITIIHFSASAELWICEVTKSTSLRTEQSSKSASIRTIPVGSTVVIDDETIDNGFVYGVYVNDNLYGYISFNCVRKVKLLPTQYGNVLEPIGGYTEFDPTVEIKNDTDREITVTLNNTQFSFEPNEVKTVTVPEGEVSIFASSPGVIPFSAVDTVANNSKYRWVFYIIKTVSKGSSHTTRKHRRTRK